MNKDDLEVFSLWVSIAIVFVVPFLMLFWDCIHFFEFLLFGAFANIGYLRAKDFGCSLRSLTGANRYFYWFLVCCSIACGAFALVELVRSF